jgi:hypothetical protein
MVARRHVSVASCTHASNDPRMRLCLDERLHTGPREGRLDYRLPDCSGSASVIRYRCPGAVRCHLNLPHAASPAIERLAHNQLTRCYENARRGFFRCDIATVDDDRSLQRTSRAALQASVKACEGREGASGHNRSLGNGSRAFEGVCGASLRHPRALCSAIGLSVAVYRPAIPTRGGARVRLSGL